jgi:hypothetical protein
MVEFPLAALSTLAMLREISLRQWHSATVEASFLNEFSEEFTPGSTLRFLVDMTTNFAGGTPDSFTFLLLDSTNNPILTIDPLGADVFLASDIGSSIDIQKFGTDPDRTTILTDPLQVSLVPEPATLLLLGSGLGCLVLSRRLKR